MKKNSLFRKDNQIIRVLEVHTGRAFVIDCIKRTMPKWMEMDVLSEYTEITEQELQTFTNMVLPDIDALDSKDKRFMYEHYTLIAGILPFVSEEDQRSSLIARASVKYEVSRKSIRNYLCRYLAYQDIAALVPMALLRTKERKKAAARELTQDEKNMRWALNKFFYNKNKNSLNTAYTLLLKEKYCDDCGILLPEYPSFYQFRYFYRKTKKLQTYYISRGGIKDYQKNHRPLLGNGVREFSSYVGVCMLDSTVLDIYLVNEAGGLVGRPLLVAAIDGYSGLCCGYSLSWEGGVYSLRGLMLNILEDKKEWCRQFGVQIERLQWDCSGYLPAVFVCDKGSEYESENFSQIAELGCTVINLPSYRPELKSAVERFFQSIQDLFKPHLKGKGVIEPDFQERGARDYRKDACLTLRQFETILLRCIVYYNTKRVIESYPYTETMIQAQVKPFACDIWEWGKLQEGANLIPVEKERLMLTMLPRTTGRFSRFGLTVNKMRYKHEDYTERYLSGGIVTVAYNPDDVSYVWLIENGFYILFELIESQYENRNLIEVEALKVQKKMLVKEARGVNTQAQIELANCIEAIAGNATHNGNTSIKGIRSNRQREQARMHKNYIKNK